jgi:enediyne polyketide synthase
VTNATTSIAIVGMACRYPDADSPEALWEMALAQRRAFRRIPPERLRLEDYLSDDVHAVDATYVREAAVLEGYAFDRVGFQVAGEAFRTTDLTHWLALDVASEALRDAGFPRGEALPRETTGVLLGNSLTGEFSRAGVLRLRWPYVRRVVQAVLAHARWAPGDRRELLAELERRYKEPFPAPNDEMLAGSLSNTIAGRICNHFDLGGGGYTVDGACASSLLAVANACSALAAGDLDVALTGGVDLSLDPFELVGFARVGALAREAMRVYDARSAGFWPGEGCGVVVLMRHGDAIAQGRRVRAVIRGWGVSSDGAGGLTRPEARGQLLALRRAYARAGFDAGTVGYFEGHGTGTAVGDATELRVLARARIDAHADGPPAAVGSVKANIGHTKAAAGVAGLIKTVRVVETKLLPPTTGCEQPHPELLGDAPALRVLREGELWLEDRPLRAGISAMGFGGINTHVVIESANGGRRHSLTSTERSLLASAQDAELFLLAAPDRWLLRERVARLTSAAPAMSRAELTDLSVHLARGLASAGDAPAAGGAVRAAVVATTGAELKQKLALLASWLENDAPAHWPRLELHQGVFLGEGGRGRVGFLFPGQGSPPCRDGGALLRRFEGIRNLYAGITLPSVVDRTATEFAQPAIVAASVAGLHALAVLGIEADVAIGHSLGELTALYWAGALDLDSLLSLAAARGRAMAEVRTPPGAMASIAAPAEQVGALLDDSTVVIAGINSPHQTVISGEAAAVERVVARAGTCGWAARRLAVSHAFHSPLLSDAAGKLARYLERVDVRTLRRSVASTVTGATLTTDDDLRALLVRQITLPVRFRDAVVAAAGVDLWLEVGPGRVLAGLARECDAAPAVSLDVGPSLHGLLESAGAAFAVGVPLNALALADGRFARPYRADHVPSFLANPCERAPLFPEDAADAPVAPSAAEARTPATPDPAAEHAAPAPASSAAATDAPDEAARTLDLIRLLVAERAELPVAVVGEHQHLLRDLHLNSITVAQVAAEAMRRLGLAPSAAPTEFADASVGHLARALTARLAEGTPARAQPDAVPEGVDSWVRAYAMRLAPHPIAPRPTPGGAGLWRIIAPPVHPLAAALEHAFASFGGGGGVVVCLPPDPDERVVPLLLAGAHAVLAPSGPRRIIFVQHGGGASAFARTLHQEASEVTTCVVDLPAGAVAFVRHVVEEAASARGFSEAHYDSAGTRHEPRFVLAPTDASATSGLGRDDVVLVTGGGNGITAECAFALARATGAALLLLGRSAAGDDTTVAANLRRLADAGVRAHYASADVTDASAVRTAVRTGEAVLGAVTAVVHGAGTNEPRLLADLDESTVLRVLGPKLSGLRNVLDSVVPTQLRLLVTFGSIIGRSGMRGAASYALANDWIGRHTEQLQVTHPGCRCVALEYSIWSGVGMGARSGLAGSLAHSGVGPITPDQGTSLFLRVVAAPPSVRTVITGRYGSPPLLPFAEAEVVPLLRFIERVQVFYPGVELVADAELSPARDPYLEDHVFDGERIFPAVMGLEAMAQAARTLMGAASAVEFESVRFERPIVVPPGAPLVLRTAAQVRESGDMEVALRSAETDFGVDHFRGLCRVVEMSAVAPLQAPPSAAAAAPASDPIEVSGELYRDVLFHGPRFRRLGGFTLLRARECAAEIRPADVTRWFGPYEAQELVLGDAGARDAAVHATQATLPHLRLLPIGADRIVTAANPQTRPATVHARQRRCEDSVFVYDLEIRDENGQLCERWDGLRLRVVRGMTRVPRSVALLGPYVERRVEELGLGATVSVALDTRRPHEDGALAERVIARAVGRHVTVQRRPDGRPEVDNGCAVSASHAGALTLAVSGRAPLACDLEPVMERSSEAWEKLLPLGRLGLARAVARDAAEDDSTAATRVWCAGECLTKAGLPPAAPLLVDIVADDDAWVTFRSGTCRVATCLTKVEEHPWPLMVALLVPQS